MLKKIRLFARLARIGSPSVYSVYFFPASFGLLLSSQLQETIGYLALFFIGSITTRGAGCIINDVCDRNFDKLVERTKKRPLASDDLTLQEALVALAILSLLSLSILLTLPKAAIIIGLIAAVMTGLYPLMKRITYLPQVFLGATINAGVLIGYASIHEAVSLPALVLYFSCCFWTLGYDTIYAFMDLEDDKKAGIKGTAILLEKHSPKLWLVAFYLSFALLFSIALFLARGVLTIPQFVGIVLASLLMLWQVVTLNIRSPSSCLIRFKANTYVGAKLMLVCLM